MAVTRTQTLLQEIEIRTDKDLIPALFLRLSLTKEQILAEFQERNLATQFIGDPSLDDLQASAEFLGKKSERKAWLFGSIAALGGALSLTPEALGKLLQELRHSQRLAVVYGFDPQSPTGELLTWSTLGASFNVELPEQILLGLPVRSIGSLSTETGTQQSQIHLIWKLVLASIQDNMQKKSRLLPGLGIGPHGRSTKRQKQARHHCMRALYEEAWLERHGELPSAQEATEV